MSARLKELYDKNIKNELYKELACKNINEVPKLVKIVLNMGVGESASDKKKIEGAIKDLTQISGQKVLVTKAKKSVATFKLREGMLLKETVTRRFDFFGDYHDDFSSEPIVQVQKIPKECLH